MLEGTIVNGNVNVGVQVGIGVTYYVCGGISVVGKTSKQCSTSFEGIIVGIVVGTWIVGTGVGIGLCVITVVGTGITTVEGAHVGNSVVGMITMVGCYGIVIIFVEGTVDTTEIGTIIGDLTVGGI